ncbi:hypothetical protein EDD99_4467 [Streptomyces sp. 846.5]|nr:hypothetical protein EDD99_4467 [Streptomyces sp. 846.5]
MLNLAYGAALHRTELCDLRLKTEQPLTGGELPLTYPACYTAPHS